MIVLPVLASLIDAALVGKMNSPLANVLSALAALALLFRGRWPVLVLLAVLPGTFTSYIWIAPMTAVYAVAVMRNRLAVTVLWASVFAVVEFFHLPLADPPIAFDRENALYAIQCIMVAAGPAALGLLARTRRELAARLDDLTRGRRREERLIADRVLATERARLAREMHDVVSHQVSLISIQAGALQVSSEDPLAQDTARTIRELSVRTLEELRQMVGVLRAAGGNAERLTPQPTLADVPKLIEASGQPVSSDFSPGSRSWPEAVERAAYRTVQESLTNISKYAPGAPVQVVVRGLRDRLRIEVHNGPLPPGAPTPAPLPGGGHGLIGLRERAQLLGGTLIAGPTPDGGFEVHADLPL